MLGRVHELPPPGAVVRVLAGEGAELAQAALAEAGRIAVVVPDAPRSFDPGARYRLWRPNEWVEETCANLPTGTAADFGCGSGRVAVWLAARGWRVLACDHLPDALDLGRDLLARYAPEGEVVWRAGGAEEVRGAFDLVVMAMCFSPRLLQAATACLNPQGVIALEAFTPTNRDETGRPGNADWTTTLEALSRSHRVVAGDEAWRGGRHTVRALLQRV